MRRREFVTGLTGAAAWSLAARAQQLTGTRRIGVLTGGVENDPMVTSFVAAFRGQLQKLGWIERVNFQIETRFSEGNSERMRKSAAELVAMNPGAIVSDNTPVVQELQRRTRTIPIVFVSLRRSRRHWGGNKSRASWRQHNRIHESRTRNEREMAGAPQGDCAEP